VDSRAGRLLFSASLLLLLTAAAPQRRDLPSLGEILEVSIVNVDVVVTDENGKRVRGLTRDDFEIFEGGVRRDLSHFAEYGAPEATVSVEGGSAPPPEAPAQKRNVAIFVERANLLPHGAEDLIESIRRAVRNTVREGDSVSLVAWTQRAQARADFDGSLTGFDAMLDALKKDLIGPPGRLRHVEDEVADLRAFNAELLAFQPNTSVDLGVENVSLFTAMQELADIRRKTMAINAIINSMAGQEGKKVLILAANRLGEVAGYEAFFAAGTPILSQEDRLRFQTKEHIASIIANANAAEVAVYPVFPTGALNYPDSSGGYFAVNLNEMHTHVRLARETGGIESSGTAEFAKVIRNVEDDLNNYYSLAYRLDSTRADRRRDLVVKTRNPAYRVRARRSYVEKSDDTRMKDRVAMALYRPPAATSFAIDAEIGRLSKRRLQSGLVPLKVRIPVRALTTVPQNGSNAGAFSVYVLAGGADENVSDIAQRTQRFEIPRRDLAKANESHFTYEVDVQLRNNTNRVAVGVLDEVSKAWSVTRLPVEREPRKEMR
jgi:VWFA-related protein